MGCLCSKSKHVPPSANESMSSRQFSVQSEQSSVVGYAASPSAPIQTMSKSRVPVGVSSNPNVEMSSSSSKNPIHTKNTETPLEKLNSIQQPEDLTALNCMSLITCPPGDQLLKRMWIKKRGHMVRTWKKRYCVLEKNLLKYYSKPDQHPPYGQHLKGKISLMGAVCNITSSESDNTICVEIYGNLGEKDLFFEMDYNIESQDWLRVLRWAIRKNTLTTLVQTFKSKSAVTEVDIKDKSSKYTTCADWQESELETYNKSVANLRSGAKAVRVLQYNKRGVRTAQPCLLTMWSAFEESVIPTENTFSSAVGISWTPILPDGQPGATRSIALRDLDDVVAYDHCELNNGENMRWFNTDLSLSNNSSRHSHCAGKPARVVSFITRFGHSLDVVACCVHDYDDVLTSFCNMVLFQAMQRKLKAAIPNARTTKEATTNLSASVCGACTAIHHTPF